MSRQLTPKQEAEIKQLQNLSQQLSTLQQNRMSMMNALQEAESALKELDGKDENEEIYRLAGSLMFKTTVGKVKEKLTRNKEIYEVQIKKFENQFKDTEQKMKELETKLKKELGIQ